MRRRGRRGGGGPGAAAAGDGVVCSFVYMDRGAETTSTEDVVGYGGTCPDVAGGSTLDGTAVQLWDWPTVPAMQWTHDGARLNALGKCLDREANGTVNGTWVHM